MPVRAVVPLLLAAATLTAAPAAAQGTGDPPPLHAFPGIVVDAATGDRIPFARVVLTRDVPASLGPSYVPAVADGRGEFVLRAPAGVYHVQLQATSVITGPVDSLRLVPGVTDTLRLSFTGLGEPHVRAQRNRVLAGDLRPCGEPWPPRGEDSLRAKVARALEDDEIGDTLLRRFLAWPRLAPADAATCARVLGALHPLAREHVFRGRNRFTVTAGAGLLLVLEEPTPPTRGAWVSSGGDRFYLLDARTLETVDTAYLGQRRASAADLVH